MSFGSQGETAYRAYAEAAYRMNIVCLNGEGGEIKDLLDKYPRNRGRQIASGRFGVNAELCNGAYVLEIKIGQGAKPGEGGHLPGSKVTAQVATARNATPGVDLISPSNNHDIYSIEDLAQVIYELQEINPLAKVAVKVPVVPNIGTIAVGIAKAGADIITLSGFDGGTGAARCARHSPRRTADGDRRQAGARGALRGWAARCRRDVGGRRHEVGSRRDEGHPARRKPRRIWHHGDGGHRLHVLSRLSQGHVPRRDCDADARLDEAQREGPEAVCAARVRTRGGHSSFAFFCRGGQARRAAHGKLGATRTQDLVGRSDLFVQPSRGRAPRHVVAAAACSEEHVGSWAVIVRYRTFEEALR